VYFSKVQRQFAMTKEQPATPKGLVAVNCVDNEPLYQFTDLTEQSFPCPFKNLC
jgi:hypothetical protein